MKKLFTILAISFFAIAQVYAISGHITTNTIWTTDQIVTGDLYIDAGVTLTIAAGVTVSFPFVDQDIDGIGDIDFVIYGRLLVQGTPSQKVYFKSNEPSPGKKDWAGIDYLTAAGGDLSTLSNMEILHAYQGFLLNGRNVTFNACRIAETEAYGLYIQSTIYSTSINNSEIGACSGFGLLHEAGTLLVNGLNIIDCDAFGFKAMDSTSIDITNMIVANAGEEGIWVENTTSASFTNSKIVSCGLVGVYISDNSPSFLNCLISNNMKHGVVVRGSLSFPTFNFCSIKESKVNGMVFANNSNGTVSNSEIVYNEGVGICIIDNSHPSINSSNIFQNFVDTSEYIIPSGPIVSWNSNQSGTVDYPIINGLTAFMVTASHTCANPTKIIDDLGRTLSTFTSTFSGHITANPSTYSTQISTVGAFCAFPAWPAYGPNELSVSSLKVLNKRLSINLATDNSTGSINAEYNYWGQVTGVNDRIYQKTSSTVSYANLYVVPVMSAGCSLPNTPPQITLTAPSGVFIDPSPLTIVWEDFDVDDNASVSIYYYAQGDTSTSIPIQIGIDEDDKTDSIVWDLNQVSDGTYIIYAEITDGNSINRDTLKNTTIVKGGLKVKMPLDAFGVPGTSVNIPINTINTIDYFNIISFQFTVAFNSSILSATGVDNVGTLSENWQVFANTSIPGQITVNGYSTVPIESGGTLINLVLDVNQAAADQATSPLTFLDFIFNAGTPTQTTYNGLFTARKAYQISGEALYYINSNPVPNMRLTTEVDNTPLEVFTDSSGGYGFPPILSGSYTVTPSYDESIPSLVITPFDASMTARYALSLYTFTNSQVAAADVDNNGSATVYDAALMAQYAVGLISDFPAGKWIIDPPFVNITLISNLANQDYTLAAVGDPSGNWSAPQTKKNRIAIDPVLANNLQEIRIPIRYGSPFSSYLLEVDYNSNHLTFIGLDKDLAIKDFQLVENNADGHLRIGAYDLDEISVTGDILTLVFLVNSSAPADLFITALFDEKEGMVVGLNEQEIPGSGMGIVYPNPSSSYAILPVSITESQQLSLKLFDVQGRLIKTIYDNTIAAGSHEIRFNTSSLEDGVYFIQMHTDDGVVSSQRFVVFRAH